MIQKTLSYLYAFVRTLLHLIIGKPIEKLIKIATNEVPLAERIIKTLLFATILPLYILTKLRPSWFAKHFQRYAEQYQTIAESASYYASTAFLKAAAAMQTIAKQGANMLLKSLSYPLALVLTSIHYLILMPLRIIFVCAIELVGQINISVKNVTYCRSYGLFIAPTICLLIFYLIKKIARSVLQLCVYPFAMIAHLPAVAGTFQDYESAISRFFQTFSRQSPTPSSKAELSEPASPPSPATSTSFHAAAAAAPSTELASLLSPAASASLHAAAASAPCAELASLLSPAASASLHAAAASAPCAKPDY